MRKLALLLLGILICCNAYAGVQPGDTPPDNYLGKTLNGQAVKLTALRGKVVVISFWASWCHYCMKEIPVLAGLQSIATQQGLKMQVVAVDYKESSHIFWRAAHILMKRLPDLLVTRDYNGDIGKPYGADKGIPVLVLLHHDGTIAYVHAGYDESELDGILAEINTLLNERSSTPPAAPATAAILFR